MRGNGRIIFGKEKVNKYFQVETIMKESFKKINLKDKVNLHSKKVDISKVSGKVIN